MLESIKKGASTDHMVDPSRAWISGFVMFTYYTVHLSNLMIAPQSARSIRRRIRIATGMS